MSKIPTAGPATDGRTLGTDWTIGNVARLLRANSGAGAWDSECPVGGSQEAANLYYMRKASALHLPTGVSVIFMRLLRENCFYASLCFAGPEGPMPWDRRVAEQWLRALFGEDRHRVRVEDAENPSVRQFLLSMNPAD